MADTPDVVVVEQVNSLEMSDADFLNAPVPINTPVIEQVAVVEPVVEPEVVADAAIPEVKAEDDAAKALPAAVADEVDNKVDTKSDNKDAVVDDKVDTPAVDFDFKAGYERILAPFKANGRDVTPKSVEDAISLMQMGANYNKKMAALKPNLKLMKLLENNGLLSEEKLSYLIELDKKNPGAINKLMKDSGIDPMDLDAEKAGEYKPKIHSVDDREIELDTVLDEIQGTASYNRTLEIVSKEWDGPSKQVIAGQPQLLKVINDHIASGIYDQISTEVDRERMFGRLNGMSDIEAYRQVGDAIQARGGFNTDPLKAVATVKPPVIVVPKPKADTEILNDKRRAASSTKATAPSVTNKDFNPLAMSDAEFSKMADTRYR